MCECKVAHQGSILGPFLFIMVLEALSKEFRTGCPRELLCADNPVIIAQLFEELCYKLTSWKVNLENKGLRENMKRTKVKFNGQNMNTFLDSGM